MKISKKVLCMIVTGLMVLSSAVIPVSAKGFSKPEEPKSNYVEGEAVVVLKDNAVSDYTKKSMAAATYGKSVKLENSFKIDANGGDGVRMAFVKSSKLSTKQLITELKKKSGVKYAFPNYKKKISAITNDTYSKYQWALENTGQNSGTEGADINADALWDKAAKAEDEVVVAVIDTGIDFEHEDLKDVIWTNPYGSKLVGKNGYDFTYTTGNGKPQDDNGHGSHVSGIIAGAADNGKGISGVNKTNVKILPLKCFDQYGGGSSYSEFSSFDYIARAAKLGANIKAVNCSYGGVGDTDEKKVYEEIFDELGASGILTVVSAGNETENLGALDPDWYDSDECLLPATNDSKYCITVAASNEYDKLTPYTNYSEKYVDVAAPGDDILSCVSYNCFNPSLYTQEQIDTLTKNYQNYNGAVTPTDFGYPKVIDEESPAITILSDATVAQSDTFFGDGGKSVSVTFNKSANAASGKEAYMLEIPFALDDENAPYRISFMASTNANIINGFAVDLPADHECYFNGSYVTEEFDFYPTDCTWDHYEFMINPNETANYLKSKERKLQIIVVANKDESVYFDDFAVSKQDVDETGFGKYDFKSGTSMSTPFVTGAVALAANSNPGASALDIYNMVCNTGRVSADLNGKVKGAHSLSLDNTEKVPPIIASVKYSEDGKNIEIEGSTNNTTQVKINGTEVTPASVTEDKVIVPDNNYNTKKIKVELTNVYGTDSFNTFISNKPNFPTTKKVTGAPEYTYELIPVSAGDKAYFVNTINGTVEMLSYKIASDKYTYEPVGVIDMTKLADKKQESTITSATYYNGKIYFTAVSAVLSDVYTLIGYDTVFACYDVSKRKTTVLCEIPNVPVDGATLTAYKGGFYIIGGYDYDEHTFLDTVYKYNSGTKAFEELTNKLPEGRAYTDFVVYGSKLVGVYGAVESGDMPSMLTFDGTNWTESSVDLDSDDKELFDRTMDKKEFYRYKGNVGLGENGVFCNGSYVYGLGDTFTYNPDNDTVTASKYSMTNSLSDGKVFGTTLPGCFIGFTADKSSVIDDDDDDYDYYSKNSASKRNAYSYDDDDDYDEDETPKTAYLVKLNNTKSDPAKQTYITLKKSSASLYVKGACQIKATVRNPKGKTTYKSSNTKVARVSSGGKITALKKGTAKITVKNNGVTKTFTVTVKNPKLNATSKTLKAGKSFTLKVTGKIGKAKFVSSNSSVAAVNSNGKVTAKKKGAAIITVTANGIKLKCKITVK